MDRLFSLTQLAMSIVMLLLTIVWGVAHTIMGTIGLFGIFVVLFFAYLMWTLVRISWVEYQQEKNK